jgi:hypothetical protein
MYVLWQTFVSGISIFVACFGPKTLVNPCSDTCMSKLGRAGNGALAKIALALQILDGKSQIKLQVAHSMLGYDSDVVS